MQATPSANRHQVNALPTAITSIKFVDYPPPGRPIPGTVFVIETDGIFVQSQEFASKKIYSATRYAVSSIRKEYLLTEGTKGKFPSYLGPPANMHREHCENPVVYLLDQDRALHDHDSL
jgi:hypothetical protein